MNNYLLISEREKINYLVAELAQKLGVNSDKLQNITTEVTDIITKSKDKSIEDILMIYFQKLESEMQKLLNERLTPGIQFGVQNENFQVFGYGGYFNKYNNKEITNDTMFSFDSISKLPVSVISYNYLKENNMSLDATVHDINNDFDLDASIKSILNFTAMVQTDKRLENLSNKETIDILKRCKENIIEKSKRHHYYQYSDIGYMTLRLSMDNFLEKLDGLLKQIDADNLTYDWCYNKNNITGGKIGMEFITPDNKGKNITFPGHTGLYGNIDSLLNLFQKILYTEEIIDAHDKSKLFEQPYLDPKVYDKDGKQLLGKNNSPQYTAKIAGIYRLPNGILDDNYSKMASCDMSELTTKGAMASTGTCGSWVVGDELRHLGRFGSYQAGLLTNPYSNVEVGNYDEGRNQIPNTNLIVNQNGIILGYQTKLNPYKELMTEYGLILELLTEYIKENDKNVLEAKKYKLVSKMGRH